MANDQLAAASTRRRRCKPSWWTRPRDVLPADIRAAASPAVYSLGNYLKRTFNIAFSTWSLVFSPPAITYIYCTPLTL